MKAATVERGKIRERGRSMLRWAVPVSLKRKDRAALPVSSTSRRRWPAGEEGGSGGEKIRNSATDLMVQGSGGVSDI